MEFTKRELLPCVRGYRDENYRPLLPVTQRNSPISVDRSSWPRLRPVIDQTRLPKRDSLVTGDSYLLSGVLGCQSREPIWYPPLFGLLGERHKGISVSSSTVTLGVTNRSRRRGFGHGEGLHFSPHSGPDLNVRCKGRFHVPVYFFLFVSPSI